MFISDFFYDAASHQFPLKNNPLFAVALHSGLKYFSVCLWLGLLAFTLVKRQKPGHSQRLYLLVTALLAALLVSVFKSLSTHSCPWDLQDFGGPFTDLTGPGRCFPSGHASVGFMWIAWLFAPLALPGVKRWQIVLFVVSIGALACFVQIARGAHFLSHVLATAWVCWAVAQCMAFIWEMAQAKLNSRSARKA
ncbi:phosphatase PAP2 family protein [Limnobacter litoralis]|uniref:Phosphoesterase n=1 Tax=Limnobacter litoralis TaxID=481366 RepID=A0ABQ5YSE7_9BURK|nr:phosphatase PAP2 family protein [Limnobacter litoralis]GLR27549.1 phosphoesterase [Limnobacter litoralis]